MAQLLIDIGAAPNDLTGDPLRTAFDKINQNFTEVYGSVLTADERAAIAGANVPSAANVFITNNDSRLTDSRTPNGAAGGDLAGSYPNPTLAANIVSNAKFRQSAGLSVVGRSANTVGDVADITGVDGNILRVSGTTLGFGNDNLATLFFRTNHGVDVAAAGVLNVGTANAATINAGKAGASINLIGDLAYANTTEFQVKDKLFTINKGGALSSGNASGFEIEENAVITGYFKTNAGRTGWELKAPGSFMATLSLSGLSADRIFTLPDAAGTIALTSDLVSIGAIDGVSKHANGAVINNKVLHMQTADATNPGLVSTGAQTFAGNKTFSGSLLFTGVTQDDTKTRIVAIDSTTGQVYWRDAGSLGAGGTISGPGSSTDNAIVRWNGAGGTNIQNSVVTLSDTGSIAGVENLTALNGAALRTGTTALDTLLLQAYDVDGAVYSTFATLTAGNNPTFDLNTLTTIGGAGIYRVGGTDVSLADGGTGHSLADPGADRIFFWDESTGHTDWLQLGTNLSITGTTLNASLAGGAVSGPGSSTDNAVVRFDGATGGVIQNSTILIGDTGSITGIENLTVLNGAALRTGTTAADTLLLQAYDVDGASYTTFATLTANDTPTMDLATSVTMGGAAIYRVGGTDVSLADGGTGASLSDPGADRILFWDESANSIAFLTAGSSLAITTTTIDVAAGGISNAMIRDSAGLSVIGRNVNSAGDVADITAAADNTVLRRSGTSIAFGTIPNATLDNSSISLATGTTGTNVNWSASPVSLGGTATLNIPDASATARGLITTGAQTIAGVKTFSGNVGIGASPTYNLDVQNAGTVQSRLLASAAGEVEFILQRTNSTATAWSQYIPNGSTDLRFYNAGDQFTIKSDGDLVWKTGSTSANIGSARTLKIGYSGGNYGGIGYNVGFTTTSDTWNYEIADVSSLLSFSAGGFLFYGTSASGTPGNPISFGNPLVRILNNGNVGIGVAPNAPLQFASTVVKRKIVLYEAANNDHQYYGFGLNGNHLAYQSQSTLADHVFYAGTSTTTSNELFRIKGNGDIFIGSGSAGAERGIFSDGSAADVALHLVTKGAAGVGFALNTIGNTRVSIIPHATTSTIHSFQELLIETTTSSYALRFAASNVTLDSSGNLTIDGTGTGTDWVATSDRRLKTNIKRVDSVLEKISLIGNLVSEYDRLDNNRHEVGFIAQELREVAPEYVFGDDLLGVNYGKMSAPLYKGMSELIDRVNELERKLAAHGITG